MSKHRSTSLFYDLFYGVRKDLLLIFYILSVGALGVLIIFLIGSIYSSSAVSQALIGLLIAIAGVVGAAFLDVLLELPKISYRFNEIRHGIAKKEINTPETFADRVVLLLCDYFSFIFFSIDYAFINIIDSAPVYSDEIILSTLSHSKRKELMEKSENTEEINYEGVYAVKGKQHHLYIIPIWFGEQCLGFIGVFTPRKLLKIFQSFLMDFEDIYIDDQLIHVLDIKKQNIQKQFYKDIDAFSNKITRGEYSEIRQYQADLVQFLVNFMRCMGGLFATVYEEECTIYLKDTFPEDGIKNEIKEYYKNYFKEHFVPDKPRIVSVPNIAWFKFIFEIPILIDDLQGVILLFDSYCYHFDYFMNIVVEIESIKLDNDLENLAKILDKLPRKDAFVRQAP